MANHRRLTKDVIIFNGIGYFLLTIFSAICIIPFMLVLSGSFSDEKAILVEGYKLIPRQFSLKAYQTIFSSPEGIFRAYGVTVFITVIGTLTGLFLSSMTAYVLQKKEFRYRNFFSFYFFFTTMFSGGIVPWYILIVRYLKLKDTLLVLIITMLFNVFNIIILRSYISTNIPDSVAESAKIDGAGEFRIFVKLILPLSKPVLATIGLFMALSYWNNWFVAMLFIDNKKLIPLQYYLHKILSEIRMIQEIMGRVPELTVERQPKESFKMAMTIVTIGPIMFLYPFLQKYFVKGIMIGAVKG